VGHAAQLGVQEGWTLRTFRGKAVGTTWESFHNDFVAEVAQLPRMAKNFLELDFAEEVVYVTERPVGVSFNTKNYPVTVASVCGHAKEIGIQPGWKLQTFEGQAIDRDFHIFFSNFVENLNILPGDYQLPLLFRDQDDFSRTIIVPRAPVGLSFEKLFPIIVTSANGLAAQLGIRPGWRMMKFADRPVSAFEEFSEFFEAYNEVLGKLPQDC
jgi:hypothetical protein